MDSLNFEIFENKINNIINNLNDGEILTIIPTLLYKDEDSIQRGLSLKSTKLSNKTNLNHLFDLIEHSLIKLANEYTLELPEAFLILKWKKWITEKEFESNKEELKDSLNNQLEGEIKKKYKNPDSFDKAVKNKKEISFDYKLKNNMIEDYGPPLFSEDENKFKNLIGYKISLFDIATPKYTIVDSLSPQPCIKVEVRDVSINNKIDLSAEPTEIFYDQFTKDGWSRKINNELYLYNSNNELINVEKEFKFSNFPLSEKSENKKDNIGTIDFETFGESEGFGQHSVYAGGWGVKDKTNLFYIKKINHPKI